MKSMSMRSVNSSNKPKKGPSFIKLSVLFILIVSFITVNKANAQPVLNPDNGHYYELVTVAVAALNWSEARDAAAAMNFNGMQGYLATVTSQAENDFIVNNISAPDVEDLRIWIGGFQAPGSLEPDQGWQWITGETWAYTNWNDGEPNNSNGDEGCLEYDDSEQWNDANCDDDSSFFLVEFESAPATGIPAVTGGGIALFSVLMACAAIFTIRRRKGVTS